MIYRLVTANNEVDLSAKVTSLLAEGWQLQGGIAVSLSESDEYRYVIFAQAMIWAKGVKG